jgi:hypothetical protein
MSADTTPRPSDDESTSLTKIVSLADTWAGGGNAPDPEDSDETLYHKLAKSIYSKANA